MARRDDGSTWESRFADYVERVADTLEHADRTAPFRSYCLGLLQPSRRKSVEAMALRVAPERMRSAHQSLHHFVANADWSDAALLRRVREIVLPKISPRGGTRVWFVAETFFPKKGAHSVGVARQYCEPLGRYDNCRIAVSLSVASERASLPVAFRLYLPKDWATDAARRAKAGVPDDVVFATRPRIALDQIRAALGEGVPQGVVQAEAYYGNEASFRAALTELGLDYVVGVKPSLRLWGPELAASGNGEAGPDALRRDLPPPTEAARIAAALPEEMKRHLVWRDDQGSTCGSCFAAMRVRTLPPGGGSARSNGEEWLLVEWRAAQSAPSGYWLSTLPADATLAHLVEIAKLRSQIERDHRQLRNELGLDHYEGRGWRGFHHHAALCIAAYGFLLCESGAAPPAIAGSTSCGPAVAIPGNGRRGRKKAF